jgi:hypothetical protein
MDKKRPRDNDNEESGHKRIRSRDNDNEESNNEVSRSPDNNEGESSNRTTNTIDEDTSKKLKKEFEEWQGESLSKIGEDLGNKAEALGLRTHLIGMSIEGLANTLDSKESLDQDSSNRMKELAVDRDYMNLVTHERKAEILRDESLDDVVAMNRMLPENEKNCQENLLKYSKEGLEVLERNYDNNPTGFEQYEKNLLDLFKTRTSILEQEYEEF